MSVNSFVHKSIIHFRAGRNDTDYQLILIVFLTDVPKPMTTLVGRFLPVPAKLNLITQQVSHCSDTKMQLGVIVS
jgi:hypothetical protein